MTGATAVSHASVDSMDYLAEPQPVTSGPWYHCFKLKRLQMEYRYKLPIASCEGAHRIIVSAAERRMLSTIGLQQFRSVQNEL